MRSARRGLACNLVSALEIAAGATRQTTSCKSFRYLSLLLRELSPAEAQYRSLCYSIYLHPALSDTPTTGATARCVARVCKRHVSPTNMEPHARWRESKRRLGEVEYRSLGKDFLTSSVTTSNASKSTCIGLQVFRLPTWHYARHQHCNGVYRKAWLLTAAFLQCIVWRCLLWHDCESRSC
jgi:hypothetical protein